MNILKALKGRRSINYFNPTKEISRKEIEKILSIANLTPSSNNLQPWEVVVVSDPERKKLLREGAFKQAKVEEASAVLIIIANPGAVEENIDKVLRRQVELGYIKEEDVEKSRNAPFRLYGDKESLVRKIFAVKNSSFFAMSIMIAARAFGFETHPMDGFSESRIKESFNIPEDRIIPLLIAIGHPKRGLKLLPRAFRRDLKDFVRYQSY